MEEEREQAHPIAPTLVDLKRHVQSLCNLIVDLTAWEGPIDACYDNNTFDWLDSLRTNTLYATYPSDAQGRRGGGDIRSLESWQHTPLTSVLNRYWETPELSAEEKKKRQGKDKNQFPPVSMPCPLAPDYKGQDDIGTIVAHANEIFEELEERLVDKGGILALYPVSSEAGFEDDDEDGEEDEWGDVKMGGMDSGIRPPSLRFKRPATSRSALEASRNTIFGQYLSYTSALAHRVTTLEAELEAAQQALAGEACVPHVLANGVIPMPTASTVDSDNYNASRTQEGNSGIATGEIPSHPVFRPLLSSQDRYVLANLSPELDARISARLSHDSCARRAAEKEAHGKIRPGRTRREHVPTAPAPKAGQDRRYKNIQNDNREAHPSQASPPPPNPAAPITANTPAAGKSSSKRRRGIDGDDDNHNDEEPPSSPSSASAPSPSSSHEFLSPSPITRSFRDMDVDDTLLPSSHHKPLTPISHVDIPARAYRVHGASKTIFIVLGVGMGPEVRVGERVSLGRAVVGREELVAGYKKWRRERKGKGRVEMDSVAPTPAPAPVAAGTGTSANVRPMHNAPVPVVNIPAPSGSKSRLG